MQRDLKPSSRQLPVTEGDVLTVRSLTAATLLSLAAAGAAPATSQSTQPVLSQRSVPLLHKDGLTFKDMNRNGRLDLYEDWRLPSRERAADLLKRMSLVQKAGLLVHAMAPNGENFDGPIELPAVQADIIGKHIRYFLNNSTGLPSDMAGRMNSAQEVAEREPLAIPVTFSSDPRNHINSAIGQSVDAGQFSQFPETLGLAATGDVDLVRNFGRIAGAELHAVGIRMTLSPMADLASEPRWGRLNGTFGSDPDAVGRFTAAYIEGFQAGRDGLHPGSVATVVKHWVGYGAEPDGYDAHNYYGRTLALTNESLPVHIRPFEQAFAVHAAGVMPTYGQPAPGLIIGGEPAEQVGAGFSRQMLQGLLRGTYGFDGIIVTDFLVAADCLKECREGTLDLNNTGMPWGVEDLTPQQRIAKAFHAGVDQIGGSSDSDLVLALARKGEISGTRIDQSVTRLLLQKFDLGEFENPYADAAASDKLVGTPASRAAALAAQQQSQVVLENRGNSIPLIAGTKVWAWNVASDALAAHGLVPESDPSAADAMLLRIAAPYQVRPNSFFGPYLKEGPLSFPPDNKDYQAFLRAAGTGKPLIVVAYLDRPAILSEIAAKAKTLVVEFGASDSAVLDILAGSACAKGKLPYELPSSNAAVAGQQPDVPDDSLSPLYARGAGMTISGCGG